VNFTANLNWFGTAFANFTAVDSEPLYSGVSNNVLINVTSVNDAPIIVLVSVTLVIPNFISPERQALKETIRTEGQLEMFQIEEQLNERFSSQESIQNLYEEKGFLAAILALGLLLGGLALFVGFILSVIFIISKLRGKEMLKPLRDLEPVRWGIADIFKVAILFFTAFYLVNILELICRTKTSSRNLLMIFNTSFLDILVFCIIVYFVIIKYRQGWAALGLSMKNWLRGVFLGITGYITILPLFLLIVLLIARVSGYFDYQPPVHPLVNIFFKEANPFILGGVIVLAVLVAPVIEEIVFRGFIYSALKKRTGVTLAIIVTSVFFSLLHMSIFSFLPIFFLGIVLAYLYEKTGLLISSITLHVIHNSLLISMILLVKGIIT